MLASVLLVKCAVNSINTFINVLKAHSGVVKMLCLGSPFMEDQIPLAGVGVWALISWETTSYWPGEGVRRLSWEIKSHWPGVGVRRLLHSH